VASEDYREASFQIWQEMAEGWDSQRAWLWEASRPVSDRMIAALDPQPGQTILELAAGTGETGFQAASAIGSQGRLIQTDFSPAMVEAARREATRLGLENVEQRVMDAERMDLDDDSVDGVLCRWGYMLMADPAAAMAETRRVLRDGGRVSLSVWGAPERNPWAAIPGRALADHTGASPSRPGEPGIFGLADHERLRSLIRGAGFGEPRLDEVEVTLRFEDFNSVWHFVTELAGGIALVLKAMPAEDRQAVRELTEQLVKDFSSDAGVALPGVALNAVAQ
jgi:ubiquinone/menaquinone biosynthesis C-methylase UbiE